MITRLERNQTPQTVNVTTSSTKIADANTARAYLRITNISDTDIYLALGATAEDVKGIFLDAAGGTFEIKPENLFVGQINGIHGGAGNKAVVFTEGVA